MKNENLNMKTMIMLLVLFLLGGFMLVGATDTTTVNDRTQADNDAQQRVPPLGMHWSRESVRKPRKDEKKKALWRQAKCDASRDLHHFTSVTRQRQGKNRKGDPGTKKQKAAWKEFGITTPFERAFAIAKRLFKNCHQLENDSIQSVLNAEVEQLLKYGTKEIKDPTYAVDYCLHVLMNLGGAFDDFFNKNGLAVKVKKNNNKNAKPKKIPKEELERRLSIRQNLTVTFNHVFTALKANKDIVEESGYTLNIKPYKHNKKKALTPYLWNSAYSRKNSPLKLAVTAEVSKNFDSTVYNDIKAKYTAEALEEEAMDTLSKWTHLQATDTKAFLKACPDGTPLFELVKDFRDTGNLVIALEKKGVDCDEEEDRLERLENSFVKAYADHKKNTMESRDDLLKTTVDKAIASKEREIRSDYHSWEITMTRKLRQNETQVTMMWHLSHMTEYKASGGGFVKNNHTGARYLLGPSNYVTAPDAIRYGFVRGLRDTSAGSRQLTGDAVSMQLILPKKPAMFTVTKDMKDRDVKKVMNCRSNKAELYTMINVALDKDKRQPAHLVMGLYTDPALLKSMGQMTAPVLQTVKPQTTRPASKPNKRKSKKSRQGPNTVKNTQKVNKAAKELGVDENVASPEDIAAYAPSASESKQTVEGHMAKMENYAGMTNLDLKEHCRAAGLRVSGNKLELVSRLTEAYMARFNVDGDNDVYDQLMKTGTASNGETSKEPTTPKRVKKGRKTPSPTRGRKTGKKSDE